MLVFFFLHFCLLSSSPVVLVLSNRKNCKESPIVVTYMSNLDIPSENWKHYTDWKGDCYEKEGKPFTKVYLWEDTWQWIRNEPDNEKRNKEKADLLNKLKACQNIIELNIDGGPYNPYRVDDIDKEKDRKETENYAEHLVEIIKGRNWERELTITWYDNSVYGMDWLFGPYKDTKKFTWTEGKTTNENVPVKTYVEFYRNLVSTTCVKDGDKDGECIGILMAYSGWGLTCETYIEGPGKYLDSCKTKFTEYSAKKGSDSWSKVDKIENLFEYLKLRKEGRKHTEL